MSQNWIKSEPQKPIPWKLPQVRLPLHLANPQYPRDKSQLALYPKVFVYKGCCPRKPTVGVGLGDAQEQLSSLVFRWCFCCFLVSFAFFPYTFILPRKQNIILLLPKVGIFRCFFQHLAQTLPHHLGSLGAPQGRCPWSLPPNFCGSVFWKRLLQSAQLLRSHPSTHCSFPSSRSLSALPIEC